MNAASPQILYCHCQYAQVVPKEVKDAVLQGLCESGLPFEAVPDLCELAARRDPLLQTISESGDELKIAACFPRAVKGLFHQAGVPLDMEKTQVLNMRTCSAVSVLATLLNTEGPQVPDSASATV